MTEKEFLHAVMNVLVLYSAGVNDGSYESLMDDLTIATTERQWDRLCAYIDTAGDWLAETDKATLYLRERFEAKCEGRKNEYPNVFDLAHDDPETRATIKRLEQKYGIKKG